MKNRLTDNKLQDAVHQILIHKPELRDSDSGLITYYWYREATDEGMDLWAMSAVDFLSLLKSEKFTSPESIRRCRQKVQELHPETRGAKYKHRHKKEKEVRDFYSPGHY